MVIHFSREALVGRASNMGDFTSRAVKAWLLLVWPAGHDDMFWEIDADYVERNRLKADEECMDMAIRAMLAHVRDCPSTELFIMRRIRETLRDEEMRTSRTPHLEGYSLVRRRLTNIWAERVTVKTGDGSTHVVEGEWTLTGGCMVLDGNAALGLRDVLLGATRLSDLPKGDSCPTDISEWNETHKRISAIIESWDGN